jgi:hypothetical protein
MIPKTKAEAELIGANLYMTGDTCKNGHVAARRTLNRVCLECEKKKAKEWYARNTALAKQRGREWKAANPARNQLSNQRSREKHRLRINLRDRLREISNRTGMRVDASAAVRYLGCSLDELREHLERRFQPGMTWENWGRRGWHMDHVRPLLHFDLTDEDHLRDACHYTNLQPLWWRDNILKGHAERRALKANTCEKRGRDAR